MDKELPESELIVKPGKLFVKLSKCQLPGQEPVYKGTLPYRQTLNIEDIATLYSPVATHILHNIRAGGIK